MEGTRPLADIKPEWSDDTRGHSIISLHNSQQLTDVSCGSFSTDLAGFAPVDFCSCPKADLWLGRTKARPVEISHGVVIQVSKPRALDAEKPGAVSRPGAIPQFLFHD